ncbi:tol-pal system-associated acyl-CoA thioesterase [Proteobacteria bacterium 005FR1]|nr:tol-pal system-associated acyl-CoA thioesterase [Proteobacteria bacterium 005FR1]
MAEFSLSVKVYIEDTDAGGIVYHANYLKFMERSRTEFITRLGYDKPATLENGLLLVVHSMRIDFQRAAVLGDELSVSTEVRKIARSYVEFEQIVSRSGDSLCRADVKVACVNRDGMKPTAIPVGLREALQSDHRDR